MPESPPEELPLLEKLQHRLQGTKPFANIDVLYIQHHLGPLIGRLNAMKASGLDPHRTWFVDIPYSTNDDVVEKLGVRGALRWNCGSSAAVEFNRAGFIELADRYEDDEIEILNRDKTIAKGIHAPIVMRQEKGKTFSLNW
jgi:hypothetical protein